MRVTDGDLITEESDIRHCDDGSRDRFEDDVPPPLKVKKRTTS